VNIFLLIIIRRPIDSSMGSCTSVAAPGVCPCMPRHTQDLGDKINMYIYTLIHRFIRISLHSLVGPIEQPFHAAHEGSPEYILRDSIAPLQHEHGAPPTLRRPAPPGSTSPPPPLRPTRPLPSTSPARPVAPYGPALFPIAVASSHVPVRRSRPLAVAAPFL